jgi:hypothetical protein
MPSETRESVRALLAHSVDYAGLFPPAALDMPTAVGNYHEYRQGVHAWLLGRFVVPVSRLEEFAGAARDRLPRDGDGEPWRIAALIGTDVQQEAERVLTFNCSHWSGSREGHATFDVAELKANTPEEIAATASRLPRTLRCFFEVPLRGDLTALARAAGAAGAGLKARTGGVTADAFPTAEEIAAFIAAATIAGVPYKVTAGLHHLVHGDYQLTYEPGAACGTMFGFLNVFLAAAAAAAGRHETIPALLTESDPSAIRFTGDGLRWRDIELHADAIARARDLLTSFGSCSFREPVDELIAAGLIT